MNISKERLAKLFNEWMRRYIDDPDGFHSQWASVKETLAEQAAGKEPSYGESCSAFIEKLDAEVAQ